MKLIVCLDERLGMMFNKRRQSSDCVQIADMRELLSGEPLAVSPYTAEFLCDTGIELRVSDTPWQLGGYCFIENTDLPPLNEVEGLVIYRWGRRYPSDKRFTLDIGGFRLVESYEFSGKSHDKITREIYEK